MEAVLAALLVVLLCLCLPSPNLGAILHPREHQETPLAILIDTLWWGNNRGRGIEKILKLGAESGGRTARRAGRAWCGSLTRPSPSMGMPC